jgi:hypothetical protein
MRFFGGGTGTSSGLFQTGSNTTLDFGGGTQNLTSTSSLTGDGGLLVSGATFNDVGSYGLTGPINISAGAATLSPTGTMSPSALTVSGGSVTFAPAEGFAAAIPTIGITGGTASFNVATTTPAFTLSGGTLAGNAPVVLTGSSIWSGGTLAGNLTVGSGVSLSINGAATKRLDGGTLTNNGTVTWSAGQILTPGTSSSTVNNYGLFDIQGDLTWGKALYDGGYYNSSTTVFNNALGATLQKSAGNSVLSLGSRDDYYIAPGYFDLNNAGTVSIAADTGTMSLYSTSLTQGGLIQVGAGSVFQRTGGFTNLSGGTLAGSGTFDVGSGTLTNAGTISPGGAGNIGTLSILGNAAFTSTGILALDLGGTAPGQSDQLAVTGNVALGGTINAALLSGYTPFGGDVVSVVSGTRSGSTSYATANLPTDFVAGYGLADGEVARLIYMGGASLAFTNTAGNLDWSSALNWSGGALPGPLDSALITDGYSVAHSTGIDTVGSLSISKNNSLTVSGGSLTVLGTTTLGGSLTTAGGTTTLSGALNGSNGSVTLQSGSLNLNAASTIGTFTQSGGTLSGSGTLTLTGVNNTWSGGSWQGDGLTVVGPGAQLSIAAADPATNPAVLQGRSVSISDGGSVSLAAYLKVDGGSNSLSIDPGASLSFLNTLGDYTGLLVNAGGLTLTQAGALQIGSGVNTEFKTLDASASLRWNGTGATTLGAGSQLSLYTLPYGTDLGSGGVVANLSGSLSVPVTARLASTSSGLTVSPAASSALQFDGTLSVNAGTTTLSLGAIPPTSIGALQLIDGSLVLDGDVRWNTYSQSGGTLSGPGTLTVFEDFQRTGGIINNTLTGVSITQASGDLTPGALSVGGPLSLTTLSGNLVVGDVVTSSNTVTLQSSGDVNIGSGASISSTAAGDAIVVAAGGNFINLAGSAALSASIGRWLVYSTDPALDTRGGLDYDFKHYGQTYGGSAYAGPGAGNGFLYTTAPTITPGLTGSLTKTYDGNTTAILTAANYITSGAIDGDLLVLNNPTVGTYNSRNVLEANSVSVGGLVIASATDSAGNAAVYGYTLTTDEVSVTGSIRPLTLSGAAIADGSSVYGASLMPGAVSFSNIIGADAVGASASVNTGALSTSGNYVAGSYSQSASTTLSGADAGNYDFSGFTTATPNYTITPATISSVTGITAASRTYDASTTASLNTASAGFTGIISGDNLTVIGASGAFSDKNADTAKSVFITGISLGGLDALNYTLASSSATTTAAISKANLLVAGASASSKVYDATTAATVTGGGITALGSDLLSLSGANAVFADKNVGTNKAVTTTYSLSGADAGNYTLLQLSGLTAEISKANLSVAGATASSKVYDATTAATVTGGGITALGSDLLTLSGANAVFADKNVGTNKAVSTAYSLSGADAGNYTLLQPTGLTAAISKANLLVAGATASSKVYDATTAATVTGGGITALGSDLLSLSGANAVFADKNVGTNKAVSTAYSLSGADAGNYTLLQTSGLTAAISKANLLVAGATASSKVYDATTAATVTGGGITALGSDLLSLSGANAVFADKNVGTNKAVTTTYSLSGADAGNYTLLQTSGLTAEISKANLLVAGATASSKVYDATTAATVTGGGITALGSDLLTLSGANAVFADKNVGTNKAVSTAYSLSGADAGNYTLLQPSGLTAEISKANLSVAGATASAKVYDATTAATVTGGGITALGSDLLSLSGANAVFADKNVGTNKAVTTVYSLSGADAGNYTLLQPTSLTAEISVRAQSTWRGEVSGLWSDPANWDALPSGANVASVLIPAGRAAVSYDAAAGSTQLQSLITNQNLSVDGGSLAVSGASSVGAGGVLSLNAGGFSTASLLNQGLVNGSGALLLDGLYSESGSGRLGTGFSSVSINQRSGDLSLRGVGASGPISLISSSGAFNLSGAVQSAGSTIGVGASGALTLAEGSSLISAGGTIALLSAAPLSVQGSRIDASGGAAGGTVLLDGSSIALTGSSVNTSGAADGGTIRIGGIPVPVGSGRSLPSSVTISGSSLVADPPGLGGTISVDGSSIAISSSSFNVFGLSGGGISFGSSSTGSLSLDASSSLLGGGGARFGLVASTISNNASSSGGVLSVNGKEPVTSVPPLVTFQQSVDSLQPLQLATTVDYTAPLSPLVTQWVAPSQELLALNLTESSFLYSETYVLPDPQPIIKPASQQPASQKSTSQPSSSQQEITQSAPSPEDEQRKRLEESLDKAGLTQSRSAALQTGGEQQAGQQAGQQSQTDPAPGTSQQRAGGLGNQPVPQLSEQQVSAQFTAGEQQAAQNTAAKLGLPTGSGVVVPSPAEVQQYLRQVIDGLRRRMSP